MTQLVYGLTPNQRLKELTLPSAHAPLIDRLKWGRFSQPYTPAFWRASLWLQDDASTRTARRSSSRQDIFRETIFCLLGGYGIKAEVSQAYFRKLSVAGIFNGAKLRESDIRRLLREPTTYKGITYGYRFPNLKARYIAEAVRCFSRQEVPQNDLSLRDWLLRLPGIGQKTAAWIVRNCLGSDNVAIIDIHLQRAGRLMGLFDARALTANTYAYFERRFLAFAQALDVQASALDLLIWETMRQHSLLRASTH